MGMCRSIGFGFQRSLSQTDCTICVFTRQCIPWKFRLVLLSRVACTRGHQKMHLPVADPIAPMRMAGMAMIRQPNDAAKERICALAADWHDKTRWKYTCQGMPPKIWKKAKIDIYSEGPARRGHILAVTLPT